VTGQQPQGIVRHAAAWPQQNHGHRLMRDLVDLRGQGVAAPHEVQATVNNAQLTALKPQQSMAICVWEPGCFQPKATFQHLESSAISASD
jgi:hypothetical protein